MIMNATEAVATQNDRAEGETTDAAEDVVVVMMATKGTEAITTTITRAAVVTGISDSTVL